MTSTRTRTLKRAPLDRARSERWALRMRGESGPAAVAVAMPAAPNQLQLSALRRFLAPPLWAGNWPISEPCLFKSCITGRSPAPGKFQPAWLALLPTDVRLLQPLGD